MRLPDPLTGFPINPPSTSGPNAVEAGARHAKTIFTHGYFKPGGQHRGTLMNRSTAKNLQLADSLQLLHNLNSIDTTRKLLR